MAREWVWWAVEQPGCMAGNSTRSAARHAPHRCRYGDGEELRCLCPRGVTRRETGGRAGRQGEEGVRVEHRASQGATRPAGGLSTSQQRGAAAKGQTGE